MKTVNVRSFILGIVSCGLAIFLTDQLRASKAERFKNQVKLEEQATCGKDKIGSFETGDLLISTQIYHGKHETIYMLFKQMSIEGRPDMIVLKSSPTSDHLVRRFDEVCGSQQFENVRVVPRKSSEFETVGLEWLRKTTSEPNK